MAERWHRPRDVAEMLGTSQSRVLALIHRGDLEAIDIAAEPGKGRPRWRITPEALERFSQQRSNWRGRSAQQSPQRRRRPTRHTERTFI